MAKVTRIKASDGPSREKEGADTPPISKKKVVAKDKKLEAANAKEVRAKEKAEKKAAKAKENKKTFILFRPFAAFGRYLKNSWKEIRQVRWPNRKATWKMVLAVLVYTAIFMILITLLDLFFSWLFGLILGNN